MIRAEYRIIRVRRRKSFLVWIIRINFVKLILYPKKNEIKTVTVLITKTNHLIVKKNVIVRFDSTLTVAGVLKD